MERLMTCAGKWVNRVLIIVLTILLCLLSIINIQGAVMELCPVYSIGSPDGHLIALTFDDGPHSEKTPEILDILKENKI